MAKKAVQKPAEFAYVLRYVQGINAQQLIGGLVANPDYSPRKEQATGMSISDWEPPRQDTITHGRHYQTLKGLIEADEYATPVSLAAFPGTEGNPPALYVLAGAPIALMYKELQRPLVAVVACHGGVFEDEEPVSKPESALPKGHIHWYDAAGWRYASVVTGLVVPDRPIQLFI